MSVSENARTRSDPENSGGHSGEAADDQEYRRAVRRAMDLLAVRAHSTRQLRIKLARKFAPGVVEKTLERLAETGLLDEPEFAREYVRQRVARSPRATGLLINELERRGVNRETAAQAVDRVLSEIGLAEQDLAEQAARKKLGALAGIETEQRKLKLFRFLSSRGFQASTARQAVEKTLGSS